VLYLIAPHKENSAFSVQLQNIISCFVPGQTLHRHFVDIIHVDRSEANKVKILLNACK